MWYEKGFVHLVEVRIGPAVSYRYSEACDKPVMVILTDDLTALS